VRVLLDTHVALWWLNDPDRLREATVEVIEDGENEAMLSAASVWEAGIKQTIGKLDTPRPLSESARKRGLVELPISWMHADRAAQLPRLHADPFDRLLVAQALVEDLVLVTRDPLIQQYDVATMPA
jgi:PIN domain nuclease of toxin-antitoxin system